MTLTMRVKHWKIFNTKVGLSEIKRIFADVESRLAVYWNDPQQYNSEHVETKLIIYSDSGQEIGHITIN